MGAGGDVNPNRFGKGHGRQSDQSGRQSGAWQTRLAPPSERLNDSPYGLDPGAARYELVETFSGHWNDRDYQQQRIAPNGTSR